MFSGRYRLGVVERVQTADGTLEVWSARDALVLKATALVLAHHLKPQLSACCFHLAGHGGAKAAVRRPALSGCTKCRTRLAVCPFAKRAAPKSR